MHEVNASLGIGATMNEHMALFSGEDRDCYFHASVAERDWGAITPITMNR